MKSSNVKTQRINIRVNNSEYDILKSKAKEANVSVSTYLREVGLHGKVNHLNNGKEIAQKIGSLHGKMQLYRHDMADQFNKIQNVLEENNQLLKSACGINNLEIADTLKYQNLRINSVLDTITPTLKIPTNFEMFQTYIKFLKNIFGFIVDGVI